MFDVHGHLKFEHTYFNSILNAELVNLTWKGFYFGLFFLIITYSNNNSISYHINHESGSIAKDYSSDQIFAMINTMTTCLALMSCMIPEALLLAVIICLNEYTQLNMFKTKQLTFRKLESFENIGAVNCLCLEKEGAINKSNDMSVKNYLIYGVDSDRMCEIRHIWQECLSHCCTAWKDKLGDDNLDDYGFRGNLTE